MGLAYYRVSSSFFQGLDHKVTVIKWPLSAKAQCPFPCSYSKAVMNWIPLLVRRPPLHRELCLAPVPRTRPPYRMQYGFILRLGQGPASYQKGCLVTIKGLLSILFFFLYQGHSQHRVIPSVMDPSAVLSSLENALYHNWETWEAAQW